MLRLRSRPAGPRPRYLGTMSLRLAACLLSAGALLLPAQARRPTPEDARKFIDDAEQKLLVLGVDSGRPHWPRSTYIIDDSEILSAKLNERYIGEVVRYAKESTKFDGLQLDPITARKIKL